MKKVLFAAFCILALCILLLTNTASVKAFEEGYERYDWNPDPENDVAIDGAWTNDTEWAINGEPTTIGDDVTFRSTWTMVSMSEVLDTWLVEFHTDTTDDAGDYWEMCIDGDQSGGTAPQIGDIKIEITGHTTLKMYNGTGTDWTEITPLSLNWSDSISTSPNSTTPHWILEFRFNKPDIGAGPQWNFRLAAYDADTDTLVAWPPTSADEPDHWGYQNYQSAVYPEALSVIAVVLLSSVAVAVSFYFLRKKPKTESYSSGKTGKVNYT